MILPKEPTILSHQVLVFQCPKTSPRLHFAYLLATNVEARASARGQD
jgi:hypothetical protein